MRIHLATSKNGYDVYMHTSNRHAATHFFHTPNLEALVKELIPQLILEKDNEYVEKDMGHIIGDSDLVETTAHDKIIYAKRLHRKNYARFAMNRQPQPTSYVTVALQKVADKKYALLSAWVGRIAPQFPGDRRETAESKKFWQTHALVWGRQKVQEGSIVKEWPWA